MSAVIFVGCHPDDIELGCAGTICAFREKAFDVICIYLTRGEMCGDPDVRMQESREALKSLGVQDGNIYFERFTDTKVPEGAETIIRLEDIYGRHRNKDIYAAFIHSVNDTHQDHRHASMAGVTAFRDVPRLFAFEAPSSTGAFHPTSFVDITLFIDLKFAALDFHNSQIAKNRGYLDREAMKSLARFRGRQAGFQVTYAEAFETLRERIEPP